MIDKVLLNSGYMHCIKIQIQKNNCTLSTIFYPRKIKEIPSGAKILSYHKNSFTCVDLLDKMYIDQLLDVSSKDLFVWTVDGFLYV